MRTLAMPDDPAGLAGWLESELIGLHLRRVAAELAVVHRGSPAPGGSLDEWLAGHKGDVLSRGLAAIPSHRLTELLLRPDWLLELQQLVLAEGGPYWDAIPRQKELDSRAARTWRRLSERLDPPATPSSVRRSPWWLRTGLPMVAASLATAAVVVLMLQGEPARPGRGREVADATPAAEPKPKLMAPKATPSPMAQPPAPREAPGAPKAISLSSGWGFTKFASGKPDVSRDEYLKQLASSAKEWFNQRPEDAAGLAKRLNEFRQGCSAILLAEHKPLAPEDRAWLKTRCQSWAAALDKHLVALEAGGDALAVRKEADETATKIAAALLGRAENPPS